MKVARGAGLSGEEAAVVLRENPRALLLRASGRGRV
jgi:hypothetical protein